MTFADRVLIFYKQLAISARLPKGVDVMNPYQGKESFTLCTLFYKKFYNDNHERRVILGINPGRFGGGLTGIPFTDPIKLENTYGIKNDLLKKPELSADFIHAMIEGFGSHEQFYGSYFINSVSPLGFTQDGKNLNYYDTPALVKATEKFIVDSLWQLTTMGINRNLAFCLGEGQNFKYLNKLNEREKIFGTIIPLAHPRFIMQYRRKHVQSYIDDYVRKLKIDFEL